MNVQHPNFPATTITWVLVTGILVLMSGCTTLFDPPAPSTLMIQDSTRDVPDIEALQNTAMEISGVESLAASINAHRLYLHKDPNNKAIWTSLANQLILHATAYTSGRSEKRSLFLESMACCEAAMRLNPDFATARESGTPLWEACHTLGEADMNAMLFWATAVLYTFREGMSLPEKVMHVEWLNHADQMLQHMETIDRNWNGGAIPFSRGIVKIALPRSKGGDKELGLKWMDESVGMANDWMLCHWGRAKYGFPFSKNEHQRRSDLQQVLALDPQARREEIYWRRYFQEDARSMLKTMGELQIP